MNPRISSSVVVWTLRLLGACIVLAGSMIGCKQESQPQPVFAEELWLVTAYDNCPKCCGKQPWNPAYGITASGKKAAIGMVACNWLPFGANVKIDGRLYTVEDRGAKSLFGDRFHHLHHLDIWCSNHEQARRFGRQYLPVEVLGGSMRGGAR